RRRLSKRPMAAPHRNRAAEELIAAGPLHAVDAKVCAADTDRVLRRPRARRVVFGGDQAVAWIERSRDGWAEVNVDEPENQIARSENGVLHSIDVGEAVHAPDELEVARTPRCVVAHGAAVFLDRLAHGWIVPTEGHVHDAARNPHEIVARQLGL